MVRRLHLSTSLALFSRPLLFCSFHILSLQVSVSILSSDVLSHLFSFQLCLIYWWIHPWLLNFVVIAIFIYLTSLWFFSPSAMSFFYSFQFSAKIFNLILYHLEHNKPHLIGCATL